MIKILNVTNISKGLPQIYASQVFKIALVYRNSKVGRYLSFYEVSASMNIPTFKKPCQK